LTTDDNLLQSLAIDDDDDGRAVQISNQGSRTIHPDTP
jgi:hypothetical protein